MVEIKITRRGPPRVLGGLKNQNPNFSTRTTDLLDASLEAIKTTALRELRRATDRRERENATVRRQEVNARLGQAAGAFDEVIRQAENTNYDNQDEVRQLDEAAAAAIGSIASPESGDEEIDTETTTRGAGMSSTFMPKFTATKDKFRNAQGMDNSNAERSDLLENFSFGTLDQDLTLAESHMETRRVFDKSLTTDAAFKSAKDRFLSTAISTGINNDLASPDIATQQRMRWMLAEGLVDDVRLQGLTPAARLGIRQRGTTERIHEGLEQLLIADGPVETKLEFAQDIYDDAVERGEMQATDVPEDLEAYAKILAADDIGAQASLHSSARKRASADLSASLIDRAAQWAPDAATAVNSLVNGPAAGTASEFLESALSNLIEQGQSADREMRFLGEHMTEKQRVKVRRDFAKAQNTLMLEMRELSIGENHAMGRAVSMGGLLGADQVSKWLKWDLFTTIREATNAEYGEALKEVTGNLQYGHPDIKDELSKNFGTSPGRTLRSALAQQAIATTGIRVVGPEMRADMDMYLFIMNDGDTNADNRPARHLETMKAIELAKELKGQKRDDQEGTDIHAAFDSLVADKQMPETARDRYFATVASTIGRVGLTRAMELANDEMDDRYKLMTPWADVKSFFSPTQIWKTDTVIENLAVTLFEDSDVSEEFTKLVRTAFPKEAADPALLERIFGPVPRLKGDNLVIMDTLEAMGISLVPIPHASGDLTKTLYAVHLKDGTRVNLKNGDALYWKVEPKRTATFRREERNRKQDEVQLLKAALRQKVDGIREFDRRFGMPTGIKSLAPGKTEREVREELKHQKARLKLMMKNIDPDTGVLVPLALPGAEDLDDELPFTSGLTPVPKPSAAEAAARARSEAEAEAAAAEERAAAAGARAEGG